MHLLICVLTMNILCSTIEGERLVTAMPGDANWSTRLDSTLKVQAEEILADVGLTMSGVFTMLLKQIVRERSIPLSLSLDSSNAVYADLLEAQSDRLNGYQGRNARDVLRDMERAIAEVETLG
jgi:DNA-damage-inducible protein J